MSEPSVPIQPPEDEAASKPAPSPHRHHHFCQLWPKGDRAEGRRRLPRNDENLRSRIIALHMLILSLEPRETTGRYLRKVDCLRAAECA